MLPNFRNPESQRVLKQQIERVGQYQQLFDKMKATYATADNTRTEMVDLAGRADKLIDRIREEVSRNAVGDEAGFARYESISHIEDDVQTLRLAVANYTAGANVGTELALTQHIERVDKAIDDLATVFAGAYREQIQQLESTIATYRNLLSTFRSNTDELAKLRESTTGLAGELDKGGDSMLEMQQALRDEDSSNARQMMIAATILALLVGVLAAWLITRQIARPLKETLEAVERIASGDLTQTLQVSRRDELGVMQQGIQRMGGTLRELIGGIRDGVTQIASAAEELSAVTEQTSAGVNGQKVETDQVATAMQEMSATAQEVARNASDASQAASDADREASQGDRVVAEAVAQIERLTAEVTRSTEAMTELQNESKKIVGVMDVIKAVAEQTNLLALNAAIEAARAGEAGRGFAVVADEVRGLAQRTQKSTEEIEVLVAGLQKGTQQVATIMHGSRELTDSSVALTRKAGDALGVITRKVSNIQAMPLKVHRHASQLIDAPHAGSNVGPSPS